MSEFIVTEKAMRPASDKRQCFYCYQPIGGKHKDDCVLIQKKALVKMTVEYEISIPSDWTKEQLEFHRNDGTWCANNALDELNKMFANKEECCMCPNTTVEYIKQTGEPFLDE